jgi:hypothetical protein
LSSFCFVLSDNIDEHYGGVCVVLLYRWKVVDVNALVGCPIFVVTHTQYGGYVCNWENGPEPIETYIVNNIFAQEKVHSLR